MEGSPSGTASMLIDRVVAIGWIFLFLACTVSFLMADTTDDVKVFIGTSALIDKSPLPFPQNVDQTWEIKPVANRLFYYAIWKFPDIWDKTIGQIHSEIEAAMPELGSRPTPGSDSLFDEAWIKIFGFLCVVTVMLLFYLTTSFFLSMTRATTLACIIGVAMLSPYNLFLLQPEWFSVLAALMAVWLVLWDSPISQALAGVVSAFIFTLKGSTIFMVPAIICAVFVVRNEIDDIDWLKNMLVGFVSACVAWALTCLINFPNAIPDMLLAMRITEYSRLGGLVGLDVVGKISYLVYMGIMSAAQTPVVIMGVIAAVAVIVIEVLRGEEQKTLIVTTTGLAGMWIFPLLSVYAVGEFYPYHYMLLTFPAVISYMSISGEESRWISLLLAIGLMIVAYYWFFSCSIWTASYGSQHAFWNQVDSDTNQINAIYAVSDQPTLLYLDTGSAPFYFRVPSYCRYSSAMVVQRGMIGDPTYRETIDCIKSYPGKYIVSSRQGWPYLVQEDNVWINNTEVIKWMYTNYDKTYEGRAWDIYERKTIV